MDTILYHAGCYDGFCAAWLCHNHWQDATYIPVQYGQRLPFDESVADQYEMDQHLRGKNVLIVDFSYPRETLEKINEASATLKVLDHHKTAKESLEGLSYCTFNMRKSGARLTWEYLRSIGLSPPTGSCGAHWLVDYTEDRDLWANKLYHSREINTALQSYPMDFDTWDQLEVKNPNDLYPEGLAIQRYKDALIKHHVKYARITNISGMPATIVECTLSDIGSDIAAALLSEYKDNPIAIIVTETPDGTIYRLRSNSIDVAKIAEQYGGGGHAPAAAFKLPNLVRSSKAIGDICK